MILGSEKVNKINELDDIPLYQLVFNPYENESKSNEYLKRVKNILKDSSPEEVRSYLKNIIHDPEVQLQEGGINKESIAIEIAYFITEIYVNVPKRENSYFSTNHNGELYITVRGIVRTGLHKPWDEFDFLLKKYGRRKIK